MKKLWVAVGVIENCRGEILIAKRHEHLHQGGKWEFPGGKVESDESALLALTRELAEEVNLTTVTAEPMMELEYDYGDKIVLLDIWHVTQFQGDAKGLENQEVRWVAKEKLSEFDFPDANEPIVERLLAS